MLWSISHVVQAAVALSAISLTTAMPMSLRADLKPDSFYAYTKKDLIGKSPGDIIRSRSIAMPALKSAKHTYQLLYVTTAINGSLIADVTSVAVPKTPAKGVEKYISIQTPEDSAALKCAPSFQLSGANSDNIDSSSDMNTALDAGYIVSSPDYESPDSAFVVGPLAGMGVLDNVRAVLSFKKAIKDASTTRIALQGYSGGALASGWASQLSASYAPELKFVGASLGGLTVNIKHILDNLAGGVFGGLTIAGIAGTAAVYPEYQDFITSHLNADGKAAFKTVTSQCLVQDTTSFAFKNAFDYIDIPKKEVYANKYVKQVFKENTLGGPLVHFPLYVFNAEKDEIIVPQDVDDYVADQCKKGGQITHVKYSFGGHATVENSGAAAAFKYVQARLNGDKLAKGCSNSTLLL